MFKSLGNLASLARQAGSMSTKMNELNEQLQGKRAQGTSGGGMVTVEINGLGDVVNVQIDPGLVESGDREMIEDLCTAATNQAIAKSRQLHAEAMQALTADFNMPQLTDAISQVMGKNDKDA